MQHLEKPVILNNNNEKETLLIVEDDEDILSLLVKNFKDRFNILIAKNCKSALDICIRESSINLIVTDIMMPIMDGKVFVKELNYIKGDLIIPIIFLTAKSQCEGYRSPLLRCRWLY